MPMNLNNTTPAAPGSNVNVTWQKDGSGNVSAYVTPGSSAYTQTDLTWDAGGHTVSPWTNVFQANQTFSGYKRLRIRATFNAAITGYAALAITKDNVNRYNLASGVGPGANAAFLQYTNATNGGHTILGNTAGVVYPGSNYFEFIIQVHGASSNSLSFIVNGLLYYGWVYDTAIDLSTGTFSVIWWEGTGAGVGSATNYVYTSTVETWS
jgi:hypothetical protein